MPLGDAMRWPVAFKLAQIWFENRLDPNWKRRPANEIEAIFTSLGLTSSFWQLG